jgi:hypothetical protein
MLDIAGGIIIAASALWLLRAGFHLLVSEQHTGGWGRFWGFVICVLALSFMYWLAIGRFTTWDDYRNLFDAIIHGRNHL